MKGQAPPPGPNAGLITLMWIGLFLVYWSPSIVAIVRNVRAPGQVVAANFFAFLFGVTWIAAWVMAFRTSRPRRAK